jgi:hypothetical protein
VLDPGLDDLESLSLREVFERSGRALWGDRTGMSV